MIPVICDRHQVEMRRSNVRSAWACPIAGCSTQIDDSEVYRLTHPGNPAATSINVTRALTVEERRRDDALLGDDSDFDPGGEHGGPAD